ncbi:MAG: phosphoglucosamine mutase [Gammaproteobacteria bacterium]
MNDKTKNNGAIKYFGTDGVRGRVGEPPMTPDILVRLGFAAGRVLCAARQSPQVLISKDTRLSGYMVESALEAGFAAAGVDVLLSGPLPTSGVSYLAQTLRLSAGVVISASHNPHNDNGVKFFGADGQKISGEMEAKIEAGMGAPTVFKGNPGRARRLDAAADRYIEFCKRAFPPHKTLRGLRILADCANGAAYHVAPPVLHELGAEVVPFAANPDGMNINVNCGVMNPLPAAKAARRCGADAAVILDGDGDRIFMADEHGRIHDGDALLFLIARDMHRRGKTPAGVVGTQMSNSSLERAVREMGAEFFRAAVGDRHILRALAEREWRIGGEPSGHLVLRDLHCTGDGIIAALQALAIMGESGRPLSALLADYRPLPQFHKSVQVANRARALNNDAAKRLIAETESRLADGGRVVVRRSGTEKLIRVMVEAKDAGVARRAAEEIAAALAAA